MATYCNLERTVFVLFDTGKPYQPALRSNALFVMLWTDRFPSSQMLGAARNLWAVELAGKLICFSSAGCM
jgi:hypothetical protein